MDSDSSELRERALYYSCITVYPLLIRRIVSHCDKNRLLNEYIFAGDNAHHEKYMITNSGEIENGQFCIYFTNNVSTETIYETMKSESYFSCTIPRKQFLTEPNKDQFIPQTMRKWQWKKSNDIHSKWNPYSFHNCYSIEHAIENKHDSVVLAIKDEHGEFDQHDETKNEKKQKKPRLKKSKSGHHMINISEYISLWHLIIFNSQFAEKNKNVANQSQTEQIDIESETCHHGIVIEKGFVHNKVWNSYHRLSKHQDIPNNQLISYTLSIPKSCYVSSKPITANDCVADNIDIIRKKHSISSGLLFVFCAYLLCVICT